MLYAIVADIHSNAIAFTAVLEDMQRRGGVDEIWCLGDIVGYGPDPRRCIELLRQYKHVCVAGNHDLGALEKVSLTHFNPDAAQAIRWTMNQLKAEDMAYLSRLPETLENGAFTLVHGSPRQPLWEYLISLGSAQESFGYFQTPYCLVGHSHTPLLFRKEGADVSFAPLSESVGQVLGPARLILNPGSVGQPRDGDPRASYAIYDSDSGIFKLHRVVYDIKAVQERFLKSSLPMRLATRLEHGA